MRWMSSLALAAAMACALAGGAAARVGGDYVFVGDIDLGGPGFWDYQTFDATSGRLYVGHVDKVTVVDVAAHKVIGSVGPLDEAHGVAVAPRVGRGFATSGGDGMVTVFDLANLRVIKKIIVGQDADGVIFDAATNTVIVTIGDGKKLAMIDPVAMTVVRTVDLPDGPEFLAADGRGKVFVNLAASARLAKVDVASGKVEAIWPLTGCKGPHGLAYDARTRRLFSGCSNRVLDVVDPASGRILATLPTGPYNDSVAVDAARGRVFSPNGDGTLTIIQEGPGDRYRVVRTMPTFLGGRSMAIDPRSGELLIAHGDTKIKGGGPLTLRFGWDHAVAAVFDPNP